MPLASNNLGENHRSGSAMVVCVKLCKKGVMVSAADQAAIFKSSFFCSVNRLMLR